MSELQNIVSLMGALGHLSYALNTHGDVANLKPWGLLQSLKDNPACVGLAQTLGTPPVAAERSPQQVKRYLDNIQGPLDTYLQGSLCAQGRVNRALALGISDFRWHLHRLLRSPEDHAASYVLLTCQGVGNRNAVKALESYTSAPIPASEQALWHSLVLAAFQASDQGIRDLSLSRLHASTETAQGFRMLLSILDASGGAPFLSSAWDWVDARAVTDSHRSDRDLLKTIGVQDEPSVPQQEPLQIVTCTHVTKRAEELFFEKMKKHVSEFVNKDIRAAWIVFKDEMDKLSTDQKIELMQLLARHQIYAVLKVERNPKPYRRLEKLTHLLASILTPSEKESVILALITDQALKSHYEGRAKDFIMLEATRVLSPENTPPIGRLKALPDNFKITWYQWVTTGFFSDRIELVDDPFVRDRVRMDAAERDVYRGVAHDILVRLGVM